jgi:hypothetical protein
MKWSVEESTEQREEREVEVGGGIEKEKEGLDHEGKGASRLTSCCMCISPSYQCHSQYSR